MIYDIFYPGTNVMDSGVTNLDAAISYLKPHELAVANNTNWDRHVYYAWEGAWLDAADLPERASIAYKAGPAWNRKEAERLDREARAERAKAQTVILQIKPLTMHSGGRSLTLSIDSDGTVLVSGGYHSTGQATAAYAAAPADWRAKVETARMAYVAAERKRTEAQALRGH